MSPRIHTLSLIEYDSWHDGEVETRESAKLLLRGFDSRSCLRPLPSPPTSAGPPSQGKDSEMLPRAQPRGGYARGEAPALKAGEGVIIRSWKGGGVVDHTSLENWQAKASRVRISPFPHSLKRTFYHINTFAAGILLDQSFFGMCEYL